MDGGEVAAYCQRLGISLVVDRGLLEESVDIIDAMSFEDGLGGADPVGEKLSSQGSRGRKFGRRVIWF